MKRLFFSLSTAVVLLAASLPLAAQKFLPKTIQFKGAPEYSDQELLNAAGLKLGTEIAYSEVKSHGQRLLDTELFESFHFTYNGTDLVFALVPSTNLFPVRLVNLPLTPGKELDAALHDRIPLYHGKVPAEGGLLDDVRGALEKVLAAKGIKATVVAMPYTDQKLFQVTAMSYAITAPPVQVGEIRIDGAAAPLNPKAKEILAKLTGSAYDVVGSPSQIETNLGNYYRDLGYLEAAVHATTQNAPIVAPEAVHIPFLVSISSGALYKISGVQLAPDLLVTQADFDRQSHIHPGDIADSIRVRENWDFIESRYHNKGYMKAVVHPFASYDHAQGTVNFVVTVEPGPVYSMGKLTIQNTAEDLRAAMQSAWKMPAGAVFNQGAAIGYYATQNVNPALERTIAASKFIFDIHLNDETHTVDVTLRLERRQ